MQLVIIRGGGVNHNFIPKKLGNIESKNQDSVTNSKNIESNSKDSKNLQNSQQFNSIDSINQYFIESKNNPVLALLNEDSKNTESNQQDSQNTESKNQDSTKDSKNIDVLPKELMKILESPIDSISTQLFETNTCPYLPKLYGIYKSVKEIDFNKLPNSFVLKTNHDSGGVIIVQDKEALLKNPFILEQMLEKLTLHLNTNYYDFSREYHYKAIESRIFAEEMLGQNGEIPDDYKIHTFKDKMYMQVDFERFSNHTRAFFTQDFEALPFSLCYPLPQNPQYLAQKPKNIESMFAIARILGSSCNYVRVDLYNIKGKIFVGELTFTHGGGTETFNPKEYDRILGDIWEI
ncbi:ATP-grasp fold amidoligase family protein [Helicobacter saguini]|uniref:ATP-grasp fold amidoligase family protein n=1 Tax=Helicobacter saguini TaxID=1548018 RepID=UPI001F35E89B|nr:ATP-grasp fold amidoligase family protein [Helicobacter saguini]